jgi:hypothetical protein
MTKRINLLISRNQEILRQLEPSCDVLCQLGKGAKDLWERLTGKGGTDIGDALKSGLEEPKPLIG